MQANLNAQQSTDFGVPLKPGVTDDNGNMIAETDSRGTLGVTLFPAHKAIPSDEHLQLMEGLCTSHGGAPTGYSNLSIDMRKV